MADKKPLSSGRWVGPRPPPAQPARPARPPPPSRPPPSRPPPPAQHALPELPLYARQWDEQPIASSLLEPPTRQVHFTHELPIELGGEYPTSQASLATHSETPTKSTDRQFANTSSAMTDAEFEKWIEDGCPPIEKPPTKSTKRQFANTSSAMTDAEFEKWMANGCPPIEKPSTKTTDQTNPYAGMDDATFQMLLEEGVIKL